MEQLQKRLEWWQEQIATKRHGIHSKQICLHIHKQPGADIQESLELGIRHAPEDSLLGWMAPKDKLAPEALRELALPMKCFSPQQLSWITCATSLPLPQAAFRAGLCDGKHWGRLPAAGTLFRRWLWDKVKADPGLRQDTFVSTEWALWRLFSKYATVAQVRQAKIASDMGDHTETFSVPDRKDALKNLARDGSLFWREITAAADGESLIITQHDERNTLQDHAQRNGVEFSQQPNYASNELFRARIPVELPPLTEVVSFTRNIFVYDDGWQYPAITEQHAFHQVRMLDCVPNNVTYVAYPWATLIDKMHRKSKDLREQLERFEAFCGQLPKDTIKITTCQHIKLKEELELFRQAGITEIFWSHTSKQDIKMGRQNGLRFHPFPLFPVQAEEASADPEASGGERAHLFSFIGARGNQYYLTNSRNWILDILGSDQRGLVVGRDSWHYNKIVYDHQVQKQGKQDKGEAAYLVNADASEQFRASLRATTFSLCPSGTGPNSIRLWESLAFGAIPVILSDSWAPPGNPDLWQAGAVFCSETPEAIEDLPARLEAIAADPEALAKLRHGAQQLWALYAPESFVTDLQVFMLEIACGMNSEPLIDGASFQNLLSQRLLAAERCAAADAEFYLSSLTSKLLLDGPNGLRAQEANVTATKAEARARTLLGEDHPFVAQLDKVKGLFHQRIAKKALTSPRLNSKAPLRVCLWGKHANRTPLAYRPFQALSRDRVAITQDPDNADVLLTGFNADFREQGDSLFAGQHRPNAPRLAVISEEPLWDSIWTTDFAERHQEVKTAEGKLSYQAFNHCNSEIFDFENIPYFLLTRADFLARYNALLSALCALSPRALLARWQTAPIRAAFFAEVRGNSAYAKAWPEHEVEGLSVYRTTVARDVSLSPVKREGRGWRPNAKRQALADWHLDKIASLSGRSCIVSSYENTHQNSYISEKIFDAFGTGGIATYYAGPNHRIHDLIPPEAYLNTYGMTAEQAGATISAFIPDLPFAEIWLKAAQILQKRLSDITAITHEYRRVTDAVVEALDMCQSSGGSDIATGELATTVAKSN
jgi:hypothetical protein